jgi:zinc transporter ZupT
MSAGSFLFISMLELLPAALHDGRFVAWKLCAFMGGFLGMAALAAYV